MGEMSVFVLGEGSEPAVVRDDDLDAQLGPFDPDDELTLRELIRDQTNASVVTYDLYSVYSMLAAVWALQQIHAGHEDPQRIARQTLGRIAVSGDFEEHVEDIDHDRELGISFLLDTVVEMPKGPMGQHVGFKWASEVPSSRSQPS
jgi:hypothetical protein